MSLAVISIPDDVRLLPPWLEDELLGLNLRALVAELAAIHQPSPLTDTVSDFLGDDLKGVLRNGLAGLPSAKIQGLLRQPRYLLQLQEIVLCDGGPYWTERQSSPGLQQVLDRDWRRIQSRLEAASPSRRDEPWYRKPVVVSLSTAAAVLLAVYVGWRAYSAMTPPVVQNPSTIGPGPEIVKTPTSDRNVPDIVKKPSTDATSSDIVKKPPEKPRIDVSPQRGWQDPKSMPQDVPAGEYYTKLARAASEYQSEKPTDVGAVAQWIVEVRLGCAALQLGDHKPLSREQRIDLLRRCRNWSNQLDEQLARLETTKDSAAATTAVREILGSMIDYLNSKAKA